MCFLAGLPRCLISLCVNVCLLAGLPLVLYIHLCECVLPYFTPTESVYPIVWMCATMIDSHGAFMSSCVLACFYALLPLGLYIFLCECVYPCWNLTESVYTPVCFHAELPLLPVYPIVWMCVILCIHDGLPQSIYILFCECVFSCWTPTDHVYPNVFSSYRARPNIAIFVLLRSDVWCSSRTIDRSKSKLIDDIRLLLNR